MGKNLPEGLTVFAFPTTHQRKLRATNLVERLKSIFQVVHYFLVQKTIVIRLRRFL
jgi:transposase-like protein